MLGAAAMTMAVQSSCSLDEDYTLSPAADTYYVTESGAEDLVNSAYSYLQNYTSNLLWYFNEMGTDIWQIGGDGQKNINNYTFDASHNYFKNLWNYSFYGITAANTLIDRADKIQASTATVNDFKGQALYLRAFYYSMLAMHFGDVPLVLHEVTAVETEATHTPVAQVYQQCITDLKEAEQLLPETATDWGRAYKYAAEALLARVYLWSGDYANAAVYAEKVIDSKKFTLLDDFAALWDCNNQKNAEFIWTIQGCSNDTYNNVRSSANHIFTVRYDVHGASWGMVRDIANGRPYRHFMPTRHFYDLAVGRMDWDNRFEKSFKWTWYVNDESKCKSNPGAVLGDTALYVPPFAVSDAQKAYAADKYRIEDINDYFDPTSANGEVTSGPREMFPQLYKYNDPTRTETGPESTLDIPIFRLGEMYLIAAEGEMKNGNTKKSADYINILRKRAAKSDADYQAHKVTADDMTIELILDERAIELTGEAQGRWPDLKRTGKLLEYVRLYNPDARANIQERHLLRPIPTSMLDRITNKDEFSQNPGY